MLQGGQARSCFLSWSYSFDPPCSAVLLLPNDRKRCSIDRHCLRSLPCTLNLRANGRALIDTLQIWRCKRQRENFPCTAHTPPTPPFPSTSTSFDIALAVYALHINHKPQPRAQRSPRQQRSPHPNQIERASLAMGSTFEDTSNSLLKRTGHKMCVHSSDTVCFCSEAKHRKRD